MAPPHRGRRRDPYPDTEEEEHQAVTVSLSTIPANLRTPGAYLEFDSSKAVNGLPPAPTRVLLIGQRLAAGTVAAGVATRIVTADQAAQAFGRGSMLHAMAAAFKKADGTTECWAIALDDLGAGVAASGTITATGPATAAGTIQLLIAGRAVPVGVAVGDTAATIATAAALAINSVADLPVTAASAAGVVTLTARHKGTTGNDIDMRASFYQGQRLPAGVALVFAAMANGAGNPDVAAVFAAIGD
ncbi:MAG: phage tail protein, partial [Sphingomonadales bacterium]|nr:phage tail protein [Sphingomonadales bacterium]